MDLVEPAPEPPRAPPSAPAHGEDGARPGRLVPAVCALSTAALVAGLALGSGASTRARAALPPEESALDLALGVGAAFLLVIWPAGALSRRTGPLGSLALEAAGVLFAPTTALVAALKLSAADFAGLARAGFVLAALAAAAVALVTSRLKPSTCVLALLVAATAAPLARFVAEAVYGRKEPFFSLLSPLELPARALGRAAPIEPPAAKEQPEAEVIALSSPTLGLFRPGIPVPLEATLRTGASAKGWIGTGEEAPFLLAPISSAVPVGGERRLSLAALFHDSMPALGQALRQAGHEVDWRPLAPDEPLALAIEPGPARRARGAQGGLRLSAPGLPGPLPTLAAFDEIEQEGTDLDPALRARLAAARALAADRARGRCANDPAVDPDLYAALGAPEAPLPLRQRVAVEAAAGALALLAAAALPRRVSRAAIPLVAVAASVALAASSPENRAIGIEQPVYRLLPGESAAAETRIVEIASLAAPTAAPLEAPGFEALTPILFARPEPRSYFILEDPERPRIDGLVLGPRERRIMVAWRVAPLAGPLAVAREASGGLRLLNRTGRDFEEAILHTEAGLALLGPLEDGGRLEVPGDAPRLGNFAFGEALEHRGRQGRALARLLLHLLRGRDPAPDRLFLVAAPEAAAVRGPAAVECRPALFVVPLGGSF